jgi:hypothetical protein
MRQFGRILPATLSDQVPETSACNGFRLLAASGPLIAGRAAF